MNSDTFTELCSMNFECSITVKVIHEKNYVPSPYCIIFYYSL